jgi:large subunit ribosomal protein LP0
MSRTVQVSEKKLAYFARITNLLRTQNRGFVVCCDHVGSLQLQQIRAAVRKESTVVFGKNTLIKKAIRALMGEIPFLEKLLPCFKYNVGFVFTQGDLKVQRDLLLANQVPASAKPGQLAQCTVVIPAQNTGLDPGQTAFFQALSIPTRINKGTIEILNDYTLLKAGDRVGNSECALLQKLGIRPFHFGLEVRYCFDNNAVFEPSILDLDTKSVASMIAGVVTDFACIGLATGIPNKASISHTMINGIRDVFAVALGTDYDFPAVASLKDRIRNPVAAVAPPKSPQAKGKAAPAAAKAKEPEPEPEQDFGMGGLFD